MNPVMIYPETCGEVAQKQEMELVYREVGG